MLADGESNIQITLARSKARLVAEVAAASEAAERVKERKSTGMQKPPATAL